MRHTLSLSLFLVVFAGCAANTTGVTPSQNKNLNVVSPNATATSEDGAMQRALDRWLKEEWTPLTSAPSTVTKTTSDGTVITTKTESTQVVVTTKTPDGQVVTKTESVTPSVEDTKPFTLQKYVDKWKVYQENKEKMDAGKPKDPSHIDMLNRMPLIGK